MKFGEKFKKIWWVILLSTLTIILIINLKLFPNSIFSNDNYELVLFIVWTCLMLIPLFGEIDLFGVKLKKDIEEVKTKMFELKSELINSNSFNPIINFHPSRDEELEKEIKSFTPRDKTANLINNEEIGEDELFLFKTRMSIEKELRRIFTNHSEFNNEEIRFETINSFLQNLNAKGLITGKFLETIKEIIAISNLGIHGEPVTKKQQFYVEFFSPVILKELKSIK